MKPLLVGEANPYGSSPEFALYPDPPNSAGGRLCRVVLGYSDCERYLDEWDRINLCPSVWSLESARQNAQWYMHERIGETVVLLGAKVTRAFGFGFQPFTSWRHTLFAARIYTTYVCLPHPSGLSRVWNRNDSVNRARNTLREAGVSWGQP